MWVIGKIPCELIFCILKQFRLQDICRIGDNDHIWFMYGCTGISIIVNTISLAFMFAVEEATSY
jgi:hypothetical protein